MSNIGENIKRIRKQKKHSQKQLAEKLRTTPQNLAQYENGKRIPKIETLQKIANALDVPLYELRGFDGSIRVNPNPERERLDTEAEKLIKRQASGESLTKEEQKKIADYIERAKESFSRLHESVKSIKNTIEELGESNLLSDYRKLNISGKEEAKKRVNELTELPRYTKKDEKETNTAEFSKELTPEKDYLLPNAAHERTDIEVTEKMEKHDDAFFDEPL